LQKYYFAGLKKFVYMVTGISYDVIANNRFRMISLYHQES
jgi:hypothetical protein